MLDWDRVVALYSQLSRFDPSPVVVLNRRVSGLPCVHPDNARELKGRLLGLLSSAASAHASLRAQFSRARRKGVTVEEMRAEAAERDPTRAACLARWLQTRGLPPLHFLVEPDTLANLADRRIFVGRRGERCVGFVVASVVPARAGWLLDKYSDVAALPGLRRELWELPAHLPASLKNAWPMARMNTSALIFDQSGRNRNAAASPMWPVVYP